MYSSAGGHPGISKHKTCGEGRGRNLRVEPNRILYFSRWRSDVIWSAILDRDDAGDQNMLLYATRSAGSELLAHSPGVPLRTLLNYALSTDSFT